MTDPHITLRFRTDEWNDFLYWMDHYLYNKDLPEPLAEVWTGLNVLIVSDNKDVYE